MPSRHPFTRSIAIILSGILFWNPLLSTAANVAVDKNAIRQGIEQAHFDTIGAGEATNGQIVIASAANEAHSRSYFESDKKTRDDIIDRVVQQSATITGNNVTLASGGGITLVSSNLQAANDVTLYSGGEINLLAAYNERYDYHHKKDKGFLSKKTKTNIISDAQAVANRIEAGGDILIQSEGNQLYQRAQLSAGEELALISGGDIRFEVTIDRHEEVHAKSDSNAFWNMNADKGQSDETVRQNEIIAKNKPIIEALGSITVQIRELPPEQQYGLGRVVGQIIASPSADKPVNAEKLSGNDITQAIEAMAAENPNLAWLKQLNDRGGIDYEKVKEAHKEWNKRHEGLGTVSAVIIVVVVTILTWGAASAAVGAAANAAGGSAAFAAGTATASAGWANVALATGISSMAGSVAGQLGTNGRVDWNQTGKTALTAMVTAGILNYPFDAFGGQSLTQLAGMSASAPLGTKTNPIPQAVGGFDGSVTQIAAIVGRGMVSAGVNSAITHSDFKDSLIGSIVGDFAALSANEIGKNWSQNGKNPNPFVHITTHTALGAGAAALTGKDAVAGALGGLAESVLDNTLQQSSWKIENGTVYTVTSMFFGGLLAEAFERDGVTAAYAAQNAAVNNRLTPKQIDEYANCVARNGVDACQGVKARLDEINKVTNDDLAQQCGGQPHGINCRQELQYANDFLSDSRFDDPAMKELFADYLGSTWEVFDLYQDQYRERIPDPLTQAELDHPTAFGGVKAVGGTLGAVGGGILLHGYGSFAVRAGFHRGFIQRGHWAVWSQADCVPNTAADILPGLPARYAGAGPERCCGIGYFDGPGAGVECGVECKQCNANGHHK